MFGDRAPLMQLAGEADGGGGTVPEDTSLKPEPRRPIVERALPGSMQSEVAAAAGQPTTAVEAEAPAVDERGEFAGGGQRGGAQSRRNPAPDFELKKGPKGKFDWRATATLEGDVSPDVAYAQAAYEKRIHDQQTLQHLVDMRASGATEAQMQAWARANDEDAEAAQTMAREHFPRMRNKVRELQQEVDDARSMKVDPYHWHESIGRGGRVAAAFAAMTGGLAAGKNNPNSAVKMMETAIEQDISAQEQNIKNTFLTLQEKKGLLADERVLFEEQLNSMNKIRAVKYAAVVARIEAAQQHAVTEAHYLSLQTAKDHFNLKLVNSIAAAQKEIIRLELDGGLNNLTKVIAYKKQIAQMKEALQVGPYGGLSVPTEQVATLEGDTVGERPEAEIRFAQAPGRAAQVAQRGVGRPTGTGRVRGGMGGPARGTGRGVAPEQEQVVQEDEFSREPRLVEDVMSSEAGADPIMTNVRLETPDEVEARVARAEKARTSKQAQVTRARRQAEVSPENITRFARTSGELGVSKEAAKHESQARAYAMQQGGVKAQLTSWPQAMADIRAGRKIRNGGMTGSVDELVIAQALAHGYEPMPSMYEGGENSLLYLNAKRQWQYTQDYPETLGRNTVDEDGNISKIQVGAGENARVFTILRGSRSPKIVETIKEEVNKFNSAVSGLERTARNIREIGLTGLFVKRDDGTMDWKIPGLTSDDPRVMQTTRDAITQAMQYIKTHDPTARISDQDLKVGLEAAANYTGGWDKFLDTAQSVFGNDTKRRQIQNYLARVAVEAQRIMFEKMSNDIIPDFNTMQSLNAQHRENDKFMRRQRRN